MAKRKLTEQQKHRISNLQKRYLESAEQQGLVISHRGKNVLVEIEAQIISCKFRQNLGFIAAGDTVIVASSEQENAIVAIEERKNILLRKTPQNTIKSVAANIDQIIITNAIIPQPNIYLIDRYLVAAIQLQIPAIIVFNKKDLLNHQEDILKLIELYKNLNYSVFVLSAHQPNTLSEFILQLAAKTSLFVGLSGVGKSSLIKAIIPEIDIKIAEISEASQEGKHTTRTATLYHFQQGDLIDVPGVRDFTPHPFNPETLLNAYPDIQKYSQACKFRDCQHLENSLGCAVQQALQENKIYLSRFETYQQIKMEIL